MTPEQEKRCHAIIHSAAVAAAAGNAVPVPALGLAVDTVVITTMAISLAGVFGGNLGQEAAKGMAFAAVKRAALKQPIRTIGREVSKLVPFLGPVVAPAITVALIEAAGWALANELDAKFNG